MAEDVCILCTGGSFDKVYGSGSGVRDFSFPDTSRAELICKRIGLTHVTIDYDSRRAKDSLDMNDDDRAQIVRWCTCYSIRHLVIVHGTDTMVETARVIAEKNLDRTIVLTGSLQPACVTGSDAEFNLGGAIAAAQVAPPGVYIFMSGQVFAWDKCRKNPQTGQFEGISSQ